MADVISWLIQGVSVLVGAFLGAFFAYRFEVRLRKQETASRREVLFKAIRHELAFIGEQVQPYDVRNVLYREPIRLSVPIRLLDGETLEYKSHAGLIQALLTLQVAVAKYDDFVQTTNLVQNLPTIPDTAHRQMYDAIVQRYQLVRAARDEVLKHVSTG